MILPSLCLSFSTQACQEGNIDYVLRHTGVSGLPWTSLLPLQLTVLAAEQSCILTLFCIPMDLLSEALQIECLLQITFPSLGRQHGIAEYLRTTLIFQMCTSEGKVSLASLHFCEPLQPFIIARKILEHASFVVGAHDSDLF